MFEGTELISVCVCVYARAHSYKDSILTKEFFLHLFKKCAIKKFLKKIKTSRSEQLLRKLCMLNEEMIIEIGDVNTYDIRR